MTTRNGSIIDNTYDGDTSHPERGNFVLMNDGRAYYGGALYYRHGLAPQSAVKPEPVDEPERLPLGTRVVIKSDNAGAHVAGRMLLAESHFGKTGVLVSNDRPGRSTRYDYFVDLDTDPEGAKYPLPVYADEVEAFDHGPNPEPEPDQPAPLAVGDRVVYTVPDTFLGEPGSRAATPGLIGELGTVIEAPYASGVRVRWDNAGLLRNSIEFVQRAPEYREVTYRSNYDAPYRHYGIQRTSDGRISCTDNRVPSGLDKFRAEAPLDKAALRPYIIRGAVMDIQPL